MEKEKTIKMPNGEICKILAMPNATMVIGAELESDKKSFWVQVEVGEKCKSFEVDIKTDNAAELLNTLTNTLKAFIQDILAKICPS